MDIRGTLQPRHQRSAVLAEILAEEMWASRPLPPLGLPDYAPPPASQTSSPLQYPELLAALASLRNGSGADQVTTELVKCSSPLFHTFFLSLLNQCFWGASVPTTWKHSHVVTLIKNSLKSSTALSKYRPISLSSTFYKVYARTLRNCLLPFVEPWLRSTQFGFRVAGCPPSLFTL